MLIARFATPSTRGPIHALVHLGFALSTGAAAFITCSLFHGVLYERLGAPVAFMTGAALASAAAVLLPLIPTDRIKDSDA